MEKPEPVSPPPRRPQPLTAGADRGFMLAAGFVILSCLVIVIAGACIFMMRWERMGSWEEATAVVIRHRPDLRDKEGKAVYVDMRYAVPRCGEYNLRLWSTAPDFYPVGSTVAVLYDPAMPQMAREDSFDGLYALPLAMMGFGSVFAVLGLLFGRIFYRGYDREL